MTPLLFPIFLVAAWLSSNATPSSGGLLSVLAKRDIGIEGGNLRGETAKISAGRDFWIASVQGTSTSTSSSSGFNASLTFGPGGVPTSGSAGVNGSSGVGSKAWTDKPSSLTAAGALDITVGQQTSVLGALINSDKGKLTLKSATLVTADLTDRDVYQSSGGGITVGFGGGFPVKNVSFDIQDRGKDGVTRATIGLGTTTLTGVTPEKAADALAQINRDPAKLQEVLKSWDFAAGGSLDVDALLKLPENLQTLAKAFEALSAPVPDDVAAMGDRAEQMFRRMIANGMSVEAATAKSQTEHFARLVQMYDGVDRAVAAYGTLDNVPKDQLRALALGETLLYEKNADGSVGVQVAVDCNIVAGNKSCQVEFNKIKAFIEAQKGSGKPWLDALATAADTSGMAYPTRMAVTGEVFKTFINCVVDNPDNPENKALLSTFIGDYSGFIRSSVSAKSAERFIAQSQAYIAGDLTVDAYKAWAGVALNEFYDVNKLAKTQRDAILIAGAATAAVYAAVVAPEAIAAIRACMAAGPTCMTPLAVVIIEAGCAEACIAMGGGALLTAAVRNPTVANKLIEQGKAFFTEAGEVLLANGTKIGQLTSVDIAAVRAGFSAEAQWANSAGSVGCPLSTSAFTGAVPQETQAIMNSQELVRLREAFARGEQLLVQVGSKTIEVIPRLPASGMTAGPNGFVLGMDAFASNVELEKTILHELYRLRYQKSYLDGTTGVSAELSARLAAEAKAFADIAYARMHR